MQFNSILYPAHQPALQSRTMRGRIFGSVIFGRRPIFGSRPPPSPTPKIISPYVPSRIGISHFLSIYTCLLLVFTHYGVVNSRSSTDTTPPKADSLQQRRQYTQTFIIRPSTVSSNPDKGIILMLLDIRSYESPRQVHRLSFSTTRTQ